MSGFMKAAMICSVATLILGIGTSPSRADLITDLAVNASLEPGGLYEYDYALSVDQSSTLGAAQLFLAVSTSADLTSVTAPSGWDIFYTTGDPDISFLSSSPSSDIAPGSFGLFSLTSYVGPAAGDFLVRGFDYNADTYAENVGAVLTPSAVPEPSSLVLGVLASAFIAAGGRARRRVCGH